MLQPINLVGCMIWLPCVWQKSLVTTGKCLVAVEERLGIPLSVNPKHVKLNENSRAWFVQVMVDGYIEDEQTLRVTPVGSETSTLVPVFTLPRTLQIF